VTLQPRPCLEVAMACPSICGMGVARGVSENAGAVSDCGIFPRSRPLLVLIKRMDLNRKDPLGGMILLKFRFGDFDGGLPGRSAGEFDLTFVDAEGLGFGLADEGGVVVAAAESDVGSDHGVDAAKLVGPFPGGGEGGDGTGGAPTEGAVIGVGGDAEILANKGPHFLDEEVGVVGAHAIVFEGAVEAGLGVFISV